MGVTCIFYIKEPSIVSNIMSTMERRIKNLFGGKKLDPWNVVCKLYKSVTFPRIPLELIKNSGRGESMYLLSFSSKPSHVYTIIDEKIVMETDNALIELVTKIKNIWTIRQTAKIDGYNYEIGDYNVRYGNLNVGSHSKGLVVEVEHTKSTSVTKSSDLLIEFIDYLIPKELYKNYKLELKRPDNGYDYTIVGLSQTKEQKDKNTANKDIKPNDKIEIDNPADSINNTNNSPSNEVLNSTINSNTSLNQNSAIGTPGSLGSTTISDIINETNKYVSTTESSMVLDAPISSTNSYTSLTASSSNINNSVLSSLATGTNTPSSHNTNSLDSSNIIATASATAKISTPTTTSLNTTSKSTVTVTAPIPTVVVPNTIPPIVRIPTVASFVPQNTLTALAGLNSLALNAAANSFKATDHTNYDMNQQPNVEGLNNITSLNTNSPTTDVSTTQFLFNSTVQTNLLNASTLSATAKTLNPLPVILNNSNVLAVTNKSIPNVFSKAKQNELLSTIKKKEPFHKHLSSSQISSLIQSPITSSYANSASSIKLTSPNNNISINSTFVPTLKTNKINTIDIKEGKEIKEVKERANYNFIFTSRHTAYQYINLLRSEKIL